MTELELRRTETAGGLRVTPAQKARYTAAAAARGLKLADWLRLLGDTEAEAFERRIKRPSKRRGELQAG